MKINKITRLVLLSVALFAGSLSAQQNLGTSNQYPIGTNEDPVLATEYCGYLNEYAWGDSSWVQSPYYDSSFMSTDQDWDVSPHAAIKRFGWVNGIFGSGYHYSVIPGHEDDRIFAVNSSAIKTSFDQWRVQWKAEDAALENNPTGQEPSDDTNDQNAEKLDKKTVIQDPCSNAAELTIKGIFYR